MTIHVLVVDDSSFIRRAVTRMLAEEADISVVGEAAQGDDALRLVHARTPDVVTLDLKMPIVGGLDTLRRIMAERPTPVVVLSAGAQADAHQTLEALAAGAVDFVDKSSVALMDVYRLRGELVQKIRLAALGGPPSARARAAKKPVASGVHRALDVVVVGASTGGPAAIRRIVGRLHHDFAVPLLAVQHMPAAFTAAFADRLGVASALPVKEAADGDRFERGVFIAPGGRHVELRGGRGARLIATVAADAKDLHVPSLDVAAASAARVAGAGVCLVVLTGMGSDGLEGARAVREAGGFVVAQDEASSVIFGMPGTVVRAGLADAVLPLDRIPEWLSRLGRRR